MSKCIHSKYNQTAKTEQDLRNVNEIVGKNRTSFT